MTKKYADRDIMEQKHYATHVFQMTAEGLHSKSDIAAELAHRDEIIDDLRALIDQKPSDEWKLTPFTEGVIQAAMRSAAEIVKPKNAKLYNNLVKQAMYIDLIFGLDNG